MKNILQLKLKLFILLFPFLLLSCTASSIEDTIKDYIDDSKTSSSTIATECRNVALQVNPDDGSDTPPASPINCSYNSETIQYSCYFVPNSETTVLHFSAKSDFIAEGLTLGLFTRNKMVYTLGANTTTTYYKYDAKDRLTATISSTGENIIYNTWDTTGRPLTASLYKTNCNNQSIAITYDASTISTVKSKGTGTACSDETILEEYDSDFNLSKRTITTTADVIVEYTVLATSKVCP